MGPRLAASYLLLGLVAAGPAWAAPGPPAKPKDLKGKALPSKTRTIQVPLPAGEKAGWSHGPYEAGDCSVCHQKNDPKNPGPLVKAGNELCYSCHEEFADIMARKFKHPPAVESCNGCHNPHNSKEKKLLVAEQAAMCFECHADIKTIAQKSKVKHDALTTGAKCSNCHNPHAANVERMLVQLPFDLCVSCHSRDGISDGRGGFLTNFKKWLDQNRIWHKPVAAKDCSACHKTHGGANFRLLVANYPKQFYAPYDLKNYALCYGCHNDKVVSEPETTTLTSFRDGSRNLHFVHVNKAERGRTCRACHEVHASNQDHHIRDGVPYGPKGWILKLNYTKTPTGGSCAKTCHETKTYTNRAAAAGGPTRNATRKR
jgi:predicted CXXCH cytochrome family protein